MSGAGDELGKHAAGLLEERAAQLALRDAESLGDAGQMPDRVDRDLGDRDVARVVQDAAVGREAAAPPSRRGSRAC